MERDWRYYVPPNLRQPLSEAGRVGYQLLDNIIGFDDSYDTTGELLARSLREDPLGTAGSMATGLYEGAREFLGAPVQTTREAADEFADAFFRALEPLPEDATREEMGQRLSDLAPFAALLGGPAAVRSVMPGRRPIDPASVDWDDPDAINTLMDQPFEYDGPDIDDVVDPYQQVPLAPEEGGLLPPPPDQILLGLNDLPDAADDPFASPYGTPVPEAERGSLLFSPTTRAAVNLEQPRYGSVDEVIANLTRNGATASEIELLRDQGVFDAMERELESAGSISSDTILETVGAAPRLSRADLIPGEGARWERNFPPGAENYRESVFTFGQQPRAFPEPFSQEHFPAIPNVAFHTRTGEFPTAEGGRAFHLGEVQSDLGRDLRGIAANTRDFNRPLNTDPLRWQLGTSQRVSELSGEYDRVAAELEDLLSSLPDPAARTPEQVEQLRLALDRRDRAARALDRAGAVSQSIFLHGDETQIFGLPTFGARGMEVEGSVPLARDTDSYNTAAIARAFSDAVDADADFLTFSTGDMAHEFSNGLLTGQRTAYDEILLRNAERYARRLGNEYDIDPPQIEQVVIQGGDREFTVPGIRLTQELRDLARIGGVPSFKNGGIVSLLNNLPTR